MTLRWLVVVPLAFYLSACAHRDDLETTRQARVASDPNAMLRIAWAAEQSGDNAGAVAFYRRAAGLQPASVPAQLGLARALAGQGSVDEAVEVLRAAYARQRSDKQIGATLGRLLVAAQRPAEALAVFEDQLLREPRSVPLLIGRGVSLDGLGRHREAQAAYREALKISPDSAPAQKDLALSQALSAAKPQAAARDGTRLWKLRRSLNLPMSAEVPAFSTGAE